MTDNEIISGLEHCINRDNPSRCGECEYVTGCKSLLLREALDLINRQRAEIERLKCDNSNIHRLFSDACKRVDELDKLNETVKAEAIKEFCKKRGIEYVETDI